nr:MAG TPA: protein of unknown function DUF4094 [Caudoviricetes sp.]
MAIKTPGKWPVLACIASCCVWYMILYPYAVHACKAILKWFMVMCAKSSLN